MARRVRPGYRSLCTIKSPAPMAKTTISLQGIWVQSVVCELRSHMPWGNEAHRPQLEKPAHCNKDLACAAKKKKSYLWGRTDSPCFTKAETKLKKGSVI